MLEIKSNHESRCLSLNTFVNPFSYVILNQKLTQGEIAKFNIYADGILVVLFERFIRGRRIGRVSFDFTSIAGDVFQSAINNKKTISFIGSTEKNIENFSQIIKKMYPELRIKDSLSGYIDNEKQRKDYLAKLCGADLVIVGMGSPLQEKLLLKLDAMHWGGSGYTCGGFIEQTAQSGGIYYPVIIDRLNLRWLYRLVREPKKLWYRYFVQYPYFVFYYLRECSK